MQKNETGISDIEIIEQVLQGDVNAFEAVVKRYEKHVLNILKKHLPYEQIEETAQEVFIRIYQSLPGFRQKSSFKHWLSSIAVRTCYDFWRKRYKSQEFSISSLSEKQQNLVQQVMYDRSSQSFYEDSLKKEAREILDWALDRLSAEDRMVLELVYLEGLTAKEAAELLGWSAANVKIRSFRSRKKLHNILKKILQEEKGGV